MGHQEHFLSRLERVDGEALKWALKLYNHAEVRNFICEALPEPLPERFAIALEAGDEPPYVILTRERQFVTCLGRGMTPYDLKIIPYSELRGFDVRIKALLGALDAIRAGGFGGYDQISGRLLEAETLLSRETFLEAALWQPLVLEQVYESMSEMVSVLHERDRLMATTSMKRLRAQSEDEIRGYWQFVCASGPLAQLMSLDVPMLRQWLPSATENPWLAKQAFYHRRCPSCAQGIWSAAKIGPSLIPSLKTRLEDPITGNDSLGSLACLAAIALRHKKSYAEISKIFEAQVKRDARDQTKPHSKTSSLYLKLLRDPEGASEASIHLGRAIALMLGKKCPPESPHHFKSIEDVPDELALPALVHVGGDIPDSEWGFMCISAGVAAIAKARAEDLYFPQAFLDDLNPGHTSRKAIQNHMKMKAELRGKLRTVKTAAKPGRNDPCLCGSGRKYKKCCGRG